MDIFIEECNSTKTLESIDLSNATLLKHDIEFYSIFECMRFQNIYLRNNGIYRINNHWEIFHESLKFIDLSQNIIEKIIVSTKFFKV